MTIQSKYREVAEELKNLGGKILIVSDNSNDGKASGLLLKTILEKLGKEYIWIPREHSRLDISLVNKLIAKESPNSIIFLDSPYPDKDLIEFAKKFNGKIIYIDHHKREIPNELPNNLIYFDVRALGQNPTPSTAGVVYRLGKILFGEEFEKYSLIAAMGSIGDFLFHDDLLVRRDFAKNYPQYYPNGNSFSPLFLDLYWG